MGHTAQDRAPRGDSGAAAVEFALVCVLVLMLVIGMVELGRLYASQLAVTHAAREGARAAAVGHFSVGYVQQQAMPLGPSGLSVSESQGTDGNGDKFVQVTVAYPVSISLLNNRWVRSARTITVSSTARMRAEF